MTYSKESTLNDEANFSEFKWSRELLIEFGNQLSEFGNANKLPLAIAIYLEDVRIYQQFLEGTSATNEIWIQRKINTVRATNHSTLFARAVMEQGAYQELNLKNHFGELAICGGGIPISANGEIYAVVIVSGLPHEDDHNLIMSQFEKFRSEHDS